MMLLIWDGLLFAISVFMRGTFLVVHIIRALLEFGLHILRYFLSQAKIIMIKIYKLYGPIICFILVFFMSKI